MYILFTSIRFAATGAFWASAISLVTETFVLVMSHVLKIGIVSILKVVVSILFMLFKIWVPLFEIQLGALFEFELLTFTLVLLLVIILLYKGGY